MRIRCTWVRWNEFSGMKPWLSCISVTFEGPWVVIDRGSDGLVALPDHIVRGRVEMREGTREPGVS